MATVNGMTAEAMQVIADASVVSGSVDSSGHLSFTTRGGTQLDGGQLPPAPDASESVKGIVELASTAEVVTGTDTTKAVTPAGVAATAATLQPLDQDLTDISNITGKTVGDFLGYQSGGWTRRSASQTKSDIGLGNVNNTADTAKPVSTAQQTALDKKANSFIYSTSAYAASAAAGTYVGPTDPGSVPDGSIWFQTAS